MTNFARAERQGLCDTFREVGPSAPTLCEGWLTADLAAHLVIRDRRPDLAAGMWIKPLEARLESAQREMATTTEWSALIDQVRSGPPVFSIARIEAVDQAMNTGEFYIHHEDVLRAAPDWTPEQRRAVAPGLQAALWNGLARMGSAMYRRSRVGVVLVADGYGRTQVKAPGELGSVVLTGDPGELLLYSYGRQAHADVVAEGSDAAVAALAGARLGIA